MARCINFSVFVAIALAISISAVPTTLQTADANQTHNNPPEKQVAQLPLTPLNLKLFGTYVTDPADRSFAIISVDEQEEQIYRVNSEIVGKSTVVKIFADEVVIDNNGAMELIKLTRPPTSKKTAATQQNHAQAEKNTQQPNEQRASNNSSNQPATPKAGQLVESSYQLQPFDKLYIQVQNEPELTMWQTINESGSINYAFVGGLEVAGLTRQQAKDLITERLTGYLSDPIIKIAINKFRSFWIGGEVNRPATYDLSAGMTVELAIKLAGGLTNRASTNRLRLTRNINGESKTLSISLTQTIRPGDFIEVGEGFF